MSGEPGAIDGQILASAVGALDALPPGQLEDELRHCCGARRFAAGMADRRPFASPEDLFAAADAVEETFGPEDWLEAFAHHPRIGDLPALRLKFASAQSKSWSRGEQAGVAGADDAVLEALAAGNETYEARYGYLFIICATGKSAAEMLAQLEMRLDNDPAIELAIAAGEQKKITRLRLHKLLARLAAPPRENDPK